MSWDNLLKARPSCGCGGCSADPLNDRAHPGGPTWRERIDHIKKWEEEFRRTEMWKKKWDWRCPDCGGMMMNRGGGGFQDGKDSFLLECLVCHHRFIGGDDTMDPVDQDNPAYVAYLKLHKEFQERIGFYDVETSFVEVGLVPDPGEEDRGWVKTADEIHGVNHFDISWCVLEELDNRQGCIKHSDPAYNAIVRKAFNTIELNRPYTITVHIQKPEVPTLWQRIWPWAYHQPYIPPYISAIKGLVLEENLVGVDRRVNQREP